MKEQNLSLKAEFQMSVSLNTFTYPIFSIFFDRLQISNKKSIKHSSKYMKVTG